MENVSAVRANGRWTNVAVPGANVLGGQTWIVWIVVASGHLTVCEVENHHVNIQFS